MQEAIWHIEQQYMEKVVAAMREGACLLDLPIGSGRFIPFYQGRNLKVLGVDISDAMLEQAAKKTGLDTNIRLERGDARTLDALASSFDYVVSWRLIHLLPDEMLSQVISELGRVNSGRIYIQAYVRDGWYYPLRAIKALKRIYGRQFGGKKPVPTPWGHIQSFSHKETRLLELFRMNDLVPRSVDTLGTYGALRVKVYVLEKSEANGVAPPASYKI